MPTVPFIPENAPFNARQRLWLNGYLAGLFAVDNHASPEGGRSDPAQPTAPLLILFGSQTGTAENIARNLAREAKTRGCNPRVLEAGTYATIDWSSEQTLLVVTSTYGDGDMPDNAQSFWDWLQTESAGALAHLNFSVLALGDSNYEHFCAAGKKIDARLEQVGATRIHPRTDCDTDYQAATKTWSEGVLNAIGQRSRVSPESANLSPAPDQHGSDKLQPASLGYSKENPYGARLVVNRRLNGEGSEKETRHYEIALEDSGLMYESGDALGILPINCPELVSDILAALDFDGEEAVSTQIGELPVRKALGTVFDITKPGLELLRRIGAHNDELRALLAPERQEDLKKWLWGREIIDLLSTTPGVRFQAAEFTGLLKKLAPRLYSIASSPKAHPGQVHLTVNTLRYQTHGRARKGVGSTFLAERVGDMERLKVFVHPSRGFRPPKNSDLAMIMIGPGTGIAPFRGFLHERRAAGAKGRNWLFFGEQRAATDFYYREELEQMLSEGHLAKLSTAFSRDQAEKIYVQHRMLENGTELWAWLQDGAHLYVCGDAARMAKDVDATLHQIAANAGGLGEERAKEFIRQLRAENRYQRDVY